MIRIGTAGWSVPAGFGGDGTQLQRYAARLNAVEINSSFYRPHRPQTYARWAESTPPDFRFAVKLPRAVTHEARLREARAPLEAFFAQAGALGDKLGPVLVQLPPSLAFDRALVDDFLAALRALFDGEAALEPRHRSWFADEPEALLRARRIGRVGADPALIPQAAMPAEAAPRYWRLHGSPKMYHTAYGEERLRGYAERLKPGDWCVFDNTASGAALTDALALQALTSPDAAPRAPRRD